MTFKKAQAVVDFMLTYGWVIIVVLIAVGVLVFFGMTHQSLMPSNCYTESPITCTDYKVTSDGVELVLANGAGADIQNVSVSVTGCSNPSGLDIMSQVWVDGTQLSLTGDKKITSCGTLKQGSGFNQQITIDYISNGISHTKKGDIHAKVE